MNDIFNGMTNEQLHAKACPDGVPHGSSFWMYWTSELNSVGRLYRQWACYPKILPLFVYSDHGVTSQCTLAKHERDNTAHVHFTFNALKAINSGNEPGKKVLLVPHPWIRYRKKKGYQPLPSAKGTLVFISHSTNNVEYVEKDRDQYFEDLKNLPEQYHPLVLCMHMHDIKKNKHLEYRKYGLPIVTLGDTSNIYFVDEFYKMVMQFKYASSNTKGSQLFFCIEMGIPYFLFGEKPELLNISDPNLPNGIYAPTQKCAKEMIALEEKLFGELRDEVTLEQRIFVEWRLGMTADICRFEAMAIVWKEFFRNFGYWIRESMKRFVKKVKIKVKNSLIG
jgi:hypothetical protein